jgi:ABC-type sugar transport system ATPase subunit
LGKERTSLGFIDHTEEFEKAQAIFKKIGIQIDPEILCADLSVAQQQIIEITKALSENAGIIIMDEPTAALSGEEVKKLFAIIRDLKRQGIGIIYISHRLEEIYEVADRVVVLRDGNYVGSLVAAETKRDELIEMMVGRSLEAEFPRRTTQIGEEILKVENLSRGIVKDVSFGVREGEVLGFAGLVGAGRTETMRLLFGADKYDSGRILIKKRLTNINSPADALRKGICLLTEDRKNQGLILVHSARDNFGLPNLDKYKKGLFIDDRKEQEEFGSFINKLNIKIAGQEQLAMNLSGGNQQKVVLAKWLAGNADIIIFDEPTRGIDVGAKYEIYLLINELAAQGKAVILVSSELPEIIGMSDRIIVMHDGRIKGEIREVSKTSQEDILSMAIN